MLCFKAGTPNSLLGKWQVLFSYILHKTQEVQFPQTLGVEQVFPLVASMKESAGVGDGVARGRLGRA
jgi:hypothetical protein